MRRLVPTAAHPDRNVKGHREIGRRTHLITKQPLQDFALTSRLLEHQFVMDLQ